MLTDKFNRVHDYLRISLTDKCNLRCMYCNPIDLPKGYFAGALRMTAEEIDQIVAVFVKEGVKKIRLTGGEPLVRKDTQEIVERLSKYPVELAVSTNGVLVNGRRVGRQILQDGDTVTVGKTEFKYQQRS